MERIYADTRGGAIKLGRQGENEAREIIFDISRWTSLYGVGVASLAHKRHGDEYPYPCDIERDGDKLVWTIKLADVANDGVGECELIYTVDNIVVKSMIWSTFVAKSLTGDLEDAPKPEQSWVDRVINSANNAVSALQKYPYISEENHHWMVWEAENGKFADTGVIAEGQPGSGSSEWGNIGGTLSNQTDLKNVLDSKANKTELEGLNPVSANSGTGTESLQTLTVGDTTYSIPQGGGSGSEGTWELIHSYTATEDIQGLSFTTDSQGNALNLKHAVLCINGDTENNGEVYFKSFDTQRRGLKIEGSGESIRFELAAKTGLVRTYVVLKIEDRHFGYLNTQTVGFGGSKLTNQQITFTSTLSDKPGNIDIVTINTATTIKSGCSIRLIGVRA